MSATAGDRHPATLRDGTPLVVEIVSDVVCPWCFIGKRRLDAALAGFDRPVELRWLPFFLNPDTPPEGEPYRPFLERKFGGAQALEDLWAQVRAAGATCGIDFAFEKIALRANTLAAHRLIHRFAGRGADTDRLVEGIFAAGFCAARFIGDPLVLADIAASCGDDREEVVRWLRSDAGADEVLAQAAEVRRWGLGGVPFFVFGRRFALSGAQSPEVLLDALRRATATA